MPTSGNVPQHLIVGARTGFLTSMKEKTYPWSRIATPINMGTKSLDLVDLGAAPMPVEDLAPQMQDFIERSLTVKPRDWNLLVWISKNAVSDDQTGTLEAKVKNAGRNFQRHINNRVFTVLNGGDSQTYGACYDGQDFFDSDHVDAGAHYATAQDNEGALALSLDNFETAMVAAQGIKDDQGEETDYTYDLIVTSPTLRRTASQIVGNPQAFDTANRETNPYAGQLDVIVSPKMDSTAWVLVASNEASKPLGLVMREQPNLQEAWFDPYARDGGRYYFKFFARFDVCFLDWRLAYLGNS
jgi:phage major head subunit gpT-like protein